MYILGIGGSDHEFSAALLHNGKIITAIEDERITRIKHGKGKWYSIPTLPSVMYCLGTNNIDLDSVDYVFANYHLEKRALSQKLKNLKIISHHLSHASCAFYPSRFENATILIIDGAGSRLTYNISEVELETISAGYGHGNQVNIAVVQSGKREIATCYWRYMTSNSIGSFYEAVTEAIGFGSYGGGKTMGLAAYGDTSIINEMLKFVSILPEGNFVFDPYTGFFDWIIDKIKKSKNPFMIRANLAYAAQYILEKGVINTINFVYKKHQNENLCYGGGCALNTVANSKIIEKTQFRRIFIHPATADNGTAIGAAYYGHYHYLNNKRNIKTNTPLKYRNIAYIGKGYSNEEIIEALNNFPVYFYRPEKLFEEVSLRLANNKIIGWFQGRSEIGPRALGNRSILANPTSPRMKDYINIKVKHRETFRPLAPVVLEEDVDKYFEFSGSSPFMLLVAKVKNEFREKFPAITHIDGTARLQTVNKYENMLLYDLLHYYKKISGHSVLLNTSFNIQGQPIVETPDQAIQSFLNMNLDLLVIGDYIAEKHTPWAKRDGMEFKDEI